jgi:TRAP-type uncharacterized transport system fused permease subunit
MFFYSQALLMQGTWVEILHVFVTAGVGIYLLAAAVQGWFFGSLNAVLRIILLVGALSMIKGGWSSDLLGLVVGAGVFLYQRGVARALTIARGAD